jgi:hypothetical protein
VEIDEELANFLECPGSLILATVDADGRPDAARAWGLEVLPDRAHVRIQLGADSVLALANIAARRSVAVTVTEMFTLRSAQVKGVPGPPAALRGSAMVHGEQHRAQFLANVVEVEQIPDEIPRRLVPPAFVAVDMTVEEVYDQTPGPGAGAPLEIRT